MHRTSTANLAASSWGHTFVIPFISDPPEPEEIDVPCGRLPADKAVDICNEIIKTAEAFRVSQNKVIFIIKTNLNLVKTLIPARISRRPARGIFNFVGQVMKTLYGVATEDDVAQLQSNLDSYNKEAELTANEVKKTESTLGSFMNLTDQRISAAIQGISHNQQELQELYEEASTTNLKLDEIQVSVRVLLLLSRNMADTLLTLQQLQLTTESWIQGIQQLLEGYLPVQIVGHQRVQDVFDHIREQLAASSGLATIAHPSVAYYYQARDILFSQDDDNLYITIKVPITAVAASIDVYSVMALSVPMNSSTHFNSTLIVNLPHFFGITRDGEFYAEFNFDLYSSCAGNDIKMCPSMISVRSRTSLSCMSAIYFDLPTQVHDLCEIRYQNAPLYEGAISLGANHYLVSGGRDESWEMVCPNKSPQPIPSCPFCILKLNCECGLSTSTWKIFAIATQCNDNEQERVTMLHTVNLPVLHALYNSHDIANIRGTTAFRKPLSVRLPSFTVRARNWSSVVEKDRVFSLDFKKMAKGLKESETIYASKSDELLAQAEATRVLPTTSGTSIGSLVWTLVNSLMAGVALILGVYLWCRSRAAAVSLAGAALPLVRPFVHMTNDSYVLQIEKVEQEINGI
jgi:hypothetical protein